MKVFTAETASKFVPLIVRYVDARTDCAPVRQDGPVQDVLKVIVSYLTEKYWQHKKKIYVCYVGEIFSVKIQLRHYEIIALKHISSHLLVRLYRENILYLRI